MVARIFAARLTDRASSSYMRLISHVTDESVNVVTSSAMEFMRSNGDWWINRRQIRRPLG